MLPSELALGSEAFGYRVEGVLGRGGMGVVYLAEDLRLGRRVALKVLAPTLAEDEGFRKRFLAESRLAASLDHPSVIPIYEAGRGRGFLFIAMRYVESGDLRGLLRLGRLRPERALRICAQVADALDFAHRRGLVHRDVKPSNVLLDRDDHVYLADFGLSRRVAERQAAEPGLPGTIDYVAPEQIRGEQVDGRTDEYALGCLFYECLTGDPPFAGSTDAAVVFAHLEQQPPAPPGLEVVMRSVLAKDLRDRYPTCTEFVMAAGDALGANRGGTSAMLRLGVTGPVCPFKGLGFFDRTDADYFSGRERLVAEVVGMLTGATLVGILGPSGIGKSSLLRAGVLPALDAGMLPGSASWRQVVLRPGEHPCEQLSRALGAEDLESALARLAPGERIVIAIDQLEEVFSDCQQEDERAAFLAQIAAAATDRARRAVVLVSLRADFYGRLAVYPEFAGLASRNHLLVGPMARAELARAIEKPASRAGLDVEPALVQTLVDDVVGEPGGLPLLSTMLLELWRARDGCTLRVESYLSSGGVRGAVARLAERVFAELSDELRSAVRLVMLRLVGGEDATLVRRRAPLAELHRLQGAEPVIAIMTDARLLTVSDNAVEVSHEALLHEWPRCRAWLEDDRVGRRLQAHLSASAREWDAGGRDAGELYRGVRLAGALDWAAQRADQLTGLEREFLDTSRLETEREERRKQVQNRRLRRLALSVAGLLALALLALAFAVNQSRHATQQRRTAQSLQVAASSQATLGTDPELSTLLALQALRTRSTDQAERALRNALPQLRLVATLNTGRALTSAAFSPDGQAIVTAGVDGTAGIWSTSSHRRLRVLHGGRIYGPVDIFSRGSAVFSPDGRSVVTAGIAPLMIWSLGTRRKPAILAERDGGALYGVAFSPDGREIASASQAGRGADTTQIWNTRTHRLLATLTEPGAGLPSGNAVYTVTYSPDGEAILTASADGQARIWSARTHRQLGVLTEPGRSPLSSAAFSPDGQHIVTASEDGTARIWSARTYHQLAELPGPGNSPLYNATFSPDGTEIVTASQDGIARIWSTNTHQQLFALTGDTGPLRMAAFSPDGTRIVTASTDGTARIWNATPVEEVGALTEPDHAPLHDAAFSNDGTEIVTASEDGTARIWSAATHQQLMVLTEPVKGANGYYGKDIASAALNPTSNEVVTASYDGTARIWTASNHRQLGSTVPPLLSAAFSRDGTQIVTAGEDGTARIWSARTHRRLAEFSDASGEFLYTAAFSPDGRDIVTAGQDGTAQIWNVAAREQVGVLTEPYNNRHQAVPAAALYSAAFSPDGKRIVTASADGTARIWSTATDRELGVLAEPGTSPLSDAQFSPDGTQILTASDDGTARIWSAQTYEQLAVFSAPGRIKSAAFNRDGTKIVTAGDDGTARIWSTELAGSVSTLTRMAEGRLIRQLTPSERRTYLPRG